jgi:hypothetical protein
MAREGKLDEQESVCRGKDLLAMMEWRDVKLYRFEICELTHRLYLLLSDPTR